MEKFVKSQLEGRNRRFIKILPHQKLQLRRGIIVKPWPQTLNPKPLSPKPKTKGPWTDTKLLQATHHHHP